MNIFTSNVTRKFLFHLFFSSSIIFLFLVSSEIASAQYTPLAPIPGYVESTVSTNDLNGYLNAMFKLGIAVAVGLAVIMIIFGGIQYMSTDAIGKKNDGKARITAAIVGLLVALGSWMLLNTLDPNLLKTELSLQGVRGGTLPTLHPGDPGYPFNQGDPEYGQPVQPDNPRYPINVSPPTPDGQQHPQSPGGPQLDCSQLQSSIDQTVEGLRAAGITNPNSIAAILGHVQQESSFNGLENDTSDPTGAHGIFQVGTPLWNQYNNWASQNGYPPGSQYAQAYYMTNRLQQSQPNLYNQFVNAQSPTEALNIWGARPGQYGSTNGWNYWGTTGRRYEYANSYNSLNPTGQNQYNCRE